MTIKKGLLIAEFMFIFIGLPFIIYLDPFPIPKILTLVVLTLFCLLFLIFDKSFDNKRLIQLNASKELLKPMFLKFALGFGLMVGIVWIFFPERLFVFPRLNFSTWVIIMLLYPLFSALPQELVYRSFFFHRYKSIFCKDTIMIAASASTFGYLHIIYDNWIALGMTLIGGILFSLTYARSKSLYMASLEHALYGCAVFTVGLGNYFYEPFG